RFQRLTNPVGAALAPRPAMTPILLSWSGGKDAAWTLHVLREQGEVEVVGLLTTITEGHERISMQGIALDVLAAQSRATGLPVLEARMPLRDRKSTRLYSHVEGASAVVCLEE